MTEVKVDGVRYAPVDEEEADDVGRRLSSFTLEGEAFWKERFQESSAKGEWNEGMYENGDEIAPFFTEAFLYNLLGKEDARSVLSIMRRLCVLAGVNYQ
jgi:hypothetical protein